MTMRAVAVLLALFAGLPAYAQTVAGEVALLTGRGTALAADGSLRPLLKGDTVFAGELISSGANSYLNLKFTDGGFILLRPNSRFQIKEYAYAEQPATPVAPAAQTPTQSAPAPAASGGNVSRAFFRLLKGGFRAVTGLVGKVDRNDYRVETPVATIGIRGTDYVVVLCDAACNSDPVLNTNLPGGSAAEGGLVVGVISGGVFVANPNAPVAELGVDQYLVTLPDGTLVRLPGEPRFLRVDPIPNPQNCGE